MAKIKKGYADTPHGQIHYRCIASNSPNSLSKPVLIFLHKSASSSVSMELLTNHYAALDYDTYAPDMPGFGGSFDPDEATEKTIKEQGTKWYCNLYAEIFTTLGIWSKVRGAHLLGHHSGASLALELANLHPEVVRTLNMVGPSIMSIEEQNTMKEKLLHAFNKPVVSGAHLLATWQYLGRNGVTAAGLTTEPPVSCTSEELALWQREAIDHIRAWKGRLQIYSAVFSQQTEDVLRGVNCPTMACCAQDDVLWQFFENPEKVKSDVVVCEVLGSNFTVDRDVEGLVKIWTPFIEKHQ
jgi:pimeloyl-ACP methyl ester carboxylesterase